MKEREVNLWAAVGACFMLVLIIISGYYSINGNERVLLSPSEDAGFVSPLNKFFMLKHKSTYHSPSHIPHLDNIGNYFANSNITMFFNEAESIQLAVKNNQINADFSLDYEIKRGNSVLNNHLDVDLYLVEFANVSYYLYKNISLGDHSPPAMYTDPLIGYMPGEIIYSNKTVVWWITFRTNDLTRAGVYNINFNVSKNGASFIKSLNVTVLNYSLPEKSNFKLFFNSDLDGGEEGYKPLDYHHALTNEQKRETLDSYMKFLSKNKIGYNYPYYDFDCESCFTYNPYYPVLPVTFLSDTEIEIDFTDFDSQMEKYFDDENMNNFVIGASITGFYSGAFPLVDEVIDQEGNPSKYERIQKLYWGEVANHLTEKGWINYSYIYMDEPFRPDLNGSSIVWMNNFTRILKNVTKEITVGVNLDIRSLIFNDSIKNFTNMDDYSIIEYSEYNPGDENKNPYRILREIVLDAMDDDDSLGVYWTSHEHVHVDRSAVDNRIWGIKYWKYNTTRNYHWENMMYMYNTSLGWIDPWKSVSYKWGAGGSTLFYPPCKGGPCQEYNPKVIHSIRIELFRDALEDYDSLVMLDKLIKEKKGLGFDTSQEETALNSAVNLVVDYGNWSRNVSEFENSRKRVYDSIMKLDSLWVGCGNMIIEEGESCDDGNIINGDGCESNCRPTPVEECGNGVIEGLEGCDDGNIANWDGCSSICKKENYYIVFGTSSKYSGDIRHGNYRGLVAADMICNAKAREAGFSTRRNWKAWLSSTSQSAASRLYHSNLEYRNVKNEIIANRWNDLSDGNLSVPINTDERGNMVLGNAWTGTFQNGSSAYYNCGNWTSNSSSGNVGVSGDANKNDSGWTNRGTSYCDVQNSIYCIEQPSCGNRINEGGEQCDDGNLNNFDGCTNLCRVPRAGGTGEEQASLDSNDVLGGAALAQ